MTRVAVYGSLRYGLHNHRLLSEAKYIGTTTTVDDVTMYSLGAFPSLSLTVGGNKAVVEVYEVDKQTLEDLDSLEGFNGKGQGNFYDRSVVKTKDLGEAFIYHIEEVGGVVVESGDWVQYVNGEAA